MNRANSHKPADQMRGLEIRLRTEQPSFSPSAGFTERVMDQLGQQLPPARPQPFFPAFKLLLGFATVGCVALLVLRFVPSREPVPDLAESVARIKIPEISVQKVEALTAKLDEPLELELKNVISDTRQAIQFVASNFLPEN